MNTIDILNYVAPYQQKDIFKGVFACDTLPKRTSYPAVFIVNLSRKTEIGSHWIAVYMHSHLDCYYFDSFGLPPKNKFIVMFLKKHAKRIYYNKRQIQHISSIKYGKYCCLFCICVLKYRSIDHFIQKFSINLYVNEIVIDQMFRNMSK